MRRTVDERECEVQVRMIRQRRLHSDDDPLELVAIIGETVLLNPVGGQKIQRAQLDHLLESADVPTITMQVLPAGQGAHLGSGFTLLSFGDLGEPDMAYVEHALGATLLEKEPDVALARLTFERLRTLALTPADSLALIRRILDG